MCMPWTNERWTHPTIFAVKWCFNILYTSLKRYVSTHIWPTHVHCDTHKHTRIHARSHPQATTITHTTQTHTHTHTHTRTHACTHARAYARPPAHTRTHAQAHAHTHTHVHTPPSPFRMSLFDGSLAPNSDTVNAPFSTCRWRSIVAGLWIIQINTRAGDTVSASCWVFFAYKKCYAELRRELVRGSAFSRYEQFER